MRAVHHTKYGSPDVLSVTEVECPAVGPHDVLVKVHAGHVTQGDRRLRAADFPGFTAVFGRLMFGVAAPRHTTPGGSFAGRVVEVGSAVSRFAVGDDVFGSLMHGAHAEFVCVPERGELARMPGNMSHAEAAALPYGAVTALVFLRDLADVKPGQRVLVHGASGGVGRIAVQVARHLGAEVTAVCSRDADLVRDLGAAHVIDYRVEDFAAGDERYDVILDTVEGNRFATVRRSLTPTGRYLTLYMTIRGLFDMGVTRVAGGRRAITGVAMPTCDLLDDVRRLAEAGVLRAPIAKRFPLDEVVDAHRALEAGTHGGAIVLDIVPDAVARARAPRYVAGAERAFATAS